MKFYTNSEFFADLAELIREYLPNEKVERVEDQNDCRLGFFVESKNDGERYICKFDGQTFCDGLDFDEKWTALEKKRYCKRRSKLCLYDCLSNVFGRQLAWGSLTGVRPTRLGYDLKKHGSNDVAAELESTFRVPQKRAKLVSDIMDNQDGLMNSDENYADFYVNIPFCVSRCSYCSFVSGDIKKQGKYVEPYIEALIHEISVTQEMAKTHGYKLNHLYIGGGTPTSLQVDQLKRILDSIKFTPKEFTVEAGRPDTIDKDKLELFKDFGVGRISVNPQTFSQRTLDLINRKHTISDIYDKFELVRSFKFDINMDLIAGLPQETIDDFIHSVDCAVSLRPENLTVHTLALKAGSVLKEQSGVSENEKETEKMLDHAHAAAKNAGYLPYYMYRQKYVIGNFENVGFCLPNKQCVYNIDMMEETANIFACGANAISKRVIFSQNRIERAANVKDFDNYILRVDEMLRKKEQIFQR